MIPYRPLYVVKLGGATAREARIWVELADLVSTGAQVLVVAGGSADIADHYSSLGRDAPMLTMQGGRMFRDARPAELAHIVDSYRMRTLPFLVASAAGVGMHAVALLAGDRGLVRGVTNGPLRIIEGDRTRVSRDQCAGTVTEVDVAAITALFATADLVCLTPPIAGADGGLLNIDADVLAASLSNATDADHLRIVTGTAGLLVDPGEPDSTIENLYDGEGFDFARDRMRQKVRAVELAKTGSADIAITGPHTLDADRGTRFWRAGRSPADVCLLTRMVDISSVSGDERELARYLLHWCRKRTLSAEIDASGNFVATKGAGPRTVLLLGHLDTVPHRWSPSWNEGVLSGRGSVDAKGCLAVFLETFAAIEPPAGVRLMLVGAVEEETTSHGAFSLRDRVVADAVVIGEPSGAHALTIGYNGLLKVSVGVLIDGAHPAGEGTVTAADRLMTVVEELRAIVVELAPNALVATLAITAGERDGAQVGEAVVDVRVPPNVDLTRMVEAVRGLSTDPVTVEILRATPGVRTTRDNVLVRSFATAFHTAGIRPRYVFKRGSSDMNTLATTWEDVPMVAYGPGDAAFDHRPDEQVTAESYRAARTILEDALERLFRKITDSQGSHA